MSRDWLITAQNVLGDLLIPRLCAGCKKRLIYGRHDPCIGTLPETRVACCGHGQPRGADGKHSGYVGLKDGRIILFSGLDGAAIRALVEQALRGQPLPETAQYAEELGWWAGLTDAQYARAQELYRQAHRQCRNMREVFGIDLNQIAQAVRAESH
jgi:hypothetical protein